MERRTLLSPQRTAVEFVSEEWSTDVRETGSNLMPAPGTDQFDFDERHPMTTFSNRPGACPAMSGITVLRDRDLLRTFVPTGEMKDEPTTPRYCATRQRLIDLPYSAVLHLIAKTNRGLR